MVEQRPFKALVVGSSPTRPTPLAVGACIYILRGLSGRHYIGSSENLARRLDEHRRGSCHTTRRLGSALELVIERKCSSIAEARALEQRLKRMRNPRAAIDFVQSLSSPD